MQGFPDNRAKKAVFRTHNCGVEPAANWLMEHSTDSDIDDPLELTVSLLSALMDNFGGLTTAA
jgi:uncharacterized UBP type Zn finger protein